MKTPTPAVATAYSFEAAQDFLRSNYTGHQLDSALSALDYANETAESIRGNEERVPVWFQADLRGMAETDKPPATAVRTMAQAIASPTFATTADADKASGDSKHTPTPYYFGSPVPVEGHESRWLVCIYENTTGLRWLVAKAFGNSEQEALAQAAFILRACNEFDSLITLACNVSNEQNSPHREQALAILSRL